MLFGDVLSSDSLLKHVVYRFFKRKYTQFLGNMSIKVAFVSCQTMRIMHEEKAPLFPLPSTYFTFPCAFLLFFSPSLSVMHVSALAAHLNASFILARRVLCVFCVALQLPHPLFYTPPPPSAAPSCSSYMLLNNGQLIWALSFFQ